MKRKLYQPNKLNTELFKLVDELNEFNEELNYYATGSKSNRLNKVEDNAIRIEQVAIEIQEKIKKMRRK